MTDRSDNEESAVSGSLTPHTTRPQVSPAQLTHANGKPAVHAETHSHRQSFRRTMLADSFITLLITIAALYFPFVYYLFTEPSFTRALDWLEILIIPGLAPLIIVTELFFNGNLPEWLTFLLAGFCQFACWLAIFLGYQRSKWWLISATVLTFGMSSFSYFVVHGLWSM